MELKLLDTVYTNKSPRFFDGYFHPITHKGRCYRVIRTDHDGTKQLEEVQRKKGSMLQSALKVASYFTIVIPLIALFIQYRSHRALGEVQSLQSSSTPNLQPPLEKQTTNVKRLYQVLYSKEVDPNFSFKGTFDLKTMGQDITPSIVDDLFAEADKKNPQACYLLSCFQYYGYGGLGDVDEVNYMWKAAELNHPKSLYHSANMLLLNTLGYIEASEYSFLEEVIEKFQAAADLGNKKAQRVLKTFFSQKHDTPICLVRLCTELLNPIEGVNAILPFYKRGFFPLDDPESFQAIKNADLIALVKEEASKQNPAATYFLGMLYHRKVLVPPCETEAHHLLVQSAKQGYVPAQYELAVKMIRSGIESEIQKGIKILHQHAKDHPPSQHYLGALYADGFVVNQDYQKSLYYLTIAAECQSYLPAYYDLAHTLIYSHHKWKNISEGIKWLTLGDKKNCYKCQNLLGNLYHTGIKYYLAQDIDKAAQYLEKAAKVGGVLEKIDYATLLSQDYPHHPANLKEALTWFSYAAETGEPSGQLALAQFCLFQKPLNKTLFKLGLDNLAEATDGGYAPAHYIEGQLLLKGEIVPKNEKLAIERFKFAANKGLIEAQYEYGKCLVEGIGVDKPDVDLGLTWLETSAKNGCLQSQWYLAQYCNGKKSPEEAAMYYVLAVEHHQHKPSMQALGNYWMNLALKSENKQEAIELCLDAINIILKANKTTIDLNDLSNLPYPLQVKKLIVKWKIGGLKELLSNS